MKNSPTNTGRLKLFPTSVPEETSHVEEGLPLIDELCEAFERSTGWGLRYEHTDASIEDASGWGTSVGSDPDESLDRLVLDRPTDVPPVNYHQARQLAGAVDRLLDRYQRTREQLWRREAELATSIPTRARPDEPTHLAARLQAVLKGGAQAVGCQAAALYLLDDATSSLKLRAVWGISLERLLEPPRPLPTAIADLEAMTGHAVVLEDASQSTYWNFPEPCGAAVCVPVSTPAIPLGTLWLFSDEARPFDDQQVNLIEITAGRLSADLEREVLMHEVVQRGCEVKQLQDAGHAFQNQMPTQSPLLDGWQISGWRSDANQLGNSFFDWGVLQDDAVACAVGQADGSPAAGALAATTMLATLRSHRQYGQSAKQIMTHVSQSLWTGSAGDRFGSMLYAVLQPESGHLQLCSAGCIHAAVLRASGCDLVGSTTAPAGCADSQFAAQDFQLDEGDVLAVMTGIRCQPDSARKNGTDPTAILGTLQNNRSWSAEQMVEHIRQQQERCDGEADPASLTVLILKRCRP